MGRLNLLPGKQRKLLNQLASRIQHGVDGLAEICRVHPRTIRDWHREKYKMSDDALRRLCIAASMPAPKVQILPEFWSVRKASRLGALKRYELYGNPGTLEGRRKGGRLSAQFFKAHPEYARARKFVLLKKIRTPKPSKALAEFIGIVIGDGGIRSPFQVTISLNRKTEGAYARWIQQVIKRFFGLQSKIYLRTHNLGGDAVISSKALVDYLGQIAGLRPGNKLKNGLDVPRWIWNRRSYQAACLRGLMDTDGDLFIHRYKVNGKEYAYPKMSFYSGSPRLLQSVRQMFNDLGFHARTTRGHRVWIDRLDEVQRFFKVIGTRHKRRRDLLSKFT